MLALGCRLPSSTTRAGCCDSCLMQPTGISSLRFRRQTIGFPKHSFLLRFGRACGRLSETATRTDGVMGDFDVAEDTNSGLKLRNDANCFEVFEAKMYSPLSSGTKNTTRLRSGGKNSRLHGLRSPASWSQTRTTHARQIPCRRAKIQIANGLFDAAMQPASISARIEERISQFTGRVRDDSNMWRDQWALPLLGKLELKKVDWESLIEEVQGRNATEAGEIKKFYDKCIQHNKVAVRGSEMTGLPVRGRIYVLRSGCNAGQKVQVCSVGRITSRVFFPRSSEESFRVFNADLQDAPDPEQAPPLNDPVRNGVYSSDMRTGQGLVPVRVLNSGDCNSRVERVNGPPGSFKVPNHQLTTA